MKKASTILVALALTLAACSSGDGSGDGGTGADTSPIKIGALGPMSGLASFVGKNMVEGIQLALDDINDKGGLLGRRVEFEVRDDEFLPDKTAIAARDLIEKENVVALFGPAGTSNYLAIARLIQDDQVPTWPIISGPELSDDVNKYAFRAFLPDGEQIEFVARYAAEHYSRIAVVALNDGEGEAFLKEARELLTKAGKPPIALERFSQDEVDFSPVVQKMRNADAIIIGNHLGVFAARIASAAKNLGIDAKLLGVAGLINYTYPDLARDAADGTVFVSFRSWGNLAKSQWPESVRTFYDAYVAKYLKGEEFSQTGAYRAYSTNFLTYDMVKVWAYAVEQAKSPEGDKVAEVLNSGFEYPKERSVIGVSWKYSEDNHDGIEVGDLYVYRWDLGANKKFTLKILGTTTDVLSGKVKL